ncbi:MAG: sigma-70 family RNA polymerase sigma factor [Gammaproteobacteria bacterium]|nr:sigma-70 family RNA polymerase sigma factor [Gammaproteobacteria bacterium]
MRNSRHAKFQLLVDGCATDLYRYAAWLTGDSAIAEDLVQDTYLGAWRALDSLKAVKASRYWLFTLLRREHVRHRVRSPARLAQPGIETVAADTERFDPDVEVCLIRRALSALPPDDCEPLILQVIAGFSCDEISALLGISVSAVTTRVARARRQVRASLGESKQSRFSTARA